MIEAERNNILGLIVGQCDKLRDDPNEHALLGNILGAANAAVREVELWRAIEALRNQVHGVKR